MMQSIDCIAVDWGTTNRRAWALTAERQVIDRRQDVQGLLAVEAGAFAASLAAFCGDWIAASPNVPIVMSGMVGSKLGWQEVPYLPAPLNLSDLSRHLAEAGTIGASTAWIVPGVSWAAPEQPEVMRGEECQILGAILASGQFSGIFLLPGTHSKWVVVDDRQITAFRTYMTGELYGLLRKTGTLSQLMTEEGSDDAAFRRGFARSMSSDGGNLLHNLFGVRSLALFDRLPRPGLASYMSGLMIGAEMQDALRWLHDRGFDQKATIIGSPALLASYQLAAADCGVELTVIDSADLLPWALLSIAGDAGLVHAG